MPLPLGDISVVDAGGPTTAYCAKLLWDLGASVTVLEPPGGHALRHQPPFDDQQTSRSLLFDWYHGGSSSTTIDPTDRSAFSATIAPADVLLVAPGQSPWPVDAELDPANPSSTIVCSITPFGRGGPYEHYKATHLTSAAMSGGMHRHGPPEGPPLVPPARIHWDLAGAHAALAILGALRARRWAVGQLIDISAQEVETTLDYYLESFGVMGASPTPRQVPAGIPPTGLWRCADGAVEICAYQAHHWRAFLELCGDSDLLRSPELADMATRREIADSLVEIIAGILAPFDRLDLLARAQAAGLPTSLLNTPAEFAADEQLQARNAIAEREIGGRKTRLPASPFRGDIRISRGTSGHEPAGASPSGAPAPVGSGPRPLTGVRVLSLGAFYAGNVAAGFLAGLGAEVVKIEPPTRSEVLRQRAYAFEPREYTEPTGATTTPMFASLARGTLNLALDVKHPEGRELFARLIPHAHIVVENFGAGIMASWGFGFEQLRALNRLLVQLSLSGYGRTGPRSTYLAYARNISSFSGVTALQDPQGQLSDAASAIHGAIAAVAALDHAHATGTAINLDIAQTEVMASLLAPVLLDPLINERDTAVTHNCIPGSAFSGVFRCMGIDSWVAIEVPDPAGCEALAALVECPDTGADKEALAGAVSLWCERLTRHSAAQLLQRAGIAAGPVQSFEDVVRDPQLRHRHFPVRLGHPELGPLEYPGPLHHTSATPPCVLEPAMTRHASGTREVLHRWLGIDEDELESLQSSGAVLCMP